MHTLKIGDKVEKNILNINPYTFTGSAVVIGLILANELTSLEQSSIGNWLQLMGLTIQTYSSQQAVVSSSTNTNNQNDDSADLETIKKTIERIEEELDKLNFSKN